MRLAVAALLVHVTSLCCATPPGVPQNIYGIHTWTNGASGIFSGKRGWTTELVYTHISPSWNLTPAQAQQIAGENLELLLRLDYSADTLAEPIPLNSANWDTFASECAAKATAFKQYCRFYIIGNEMNADFLRNVPAATTVEVYRRCRTAIHAVQPEAVVIVPAVAPWNSGRDAAYPYSAYSPSRWLNYMYEMVSTLGADADAYAIHAYGGRGGDSDPRDDNEMGFGAFKKWMEIIDGNAYARSVPVFLTEFNHAADGQRAPGIPKYDYVAGYIQKGFEAVNTWNMQNGYQIKCACWFSYANGGFPGYNITGNSQMQSDFSWTTQNTNYFGYINAAVDWGLFGEQ